MPYSIFHIPKSILRHVLSKKYNNWEEYDSSCNRKKIEIPFNTIQKIFKLTNLNIYKFRAELINKDNTYHYIKYWIKNTYNISNHDDGCPITIIIYLKKDKSIKDQFYIENKLVTENVWSNNTDTYGALVMWNINNSKLGPDHYGHITGNGERDILCLFL